MVCKLQKSIYKLKQASKSWNIVFKFNQTITSFGFEKSLDEPYVYKMIKGRNIFFVILYVNDILLIGKDK